MMKLIDLNPRWYNAGGPGVTYAATGKPVPERRGVGMTFDCPCGKCGEGVSIQFSNPLDGGAVLKEGRAAWKRTGITFETLTLRPSIQRLRTCDWHGFLTDGEFKSV